MYQACKLDATATRQPAPTLAMAWSATLYDSANKGAWLHPQPPPRAAIRPHGTELCRCPLNLERISFECAVSSQDTGGPPQPVLVATGASLTVEPKPAPAGIREPYKPWQTAPGLLQHGDCA